MRLLSCRFAHDSVDLTQFERENRLEFEVAMPFDQSTTAIGGILEAHQDAQ